MNRMLNTIFMFVTAAALAVGCSDVSDIENRLETLESKVTALEMMLPGIDDNLSTVETLLEGGKLISEVKQDASGAYTIVLSDGSELPLVAGTAAADGFFASVSYSDNLFKVKLKDGGQEIAIPVVSSFRFSIQGADKVQYFESGQTKEFAVEKQGVSSAVVTVPSGWKGVMDESTLKVTAPAEVKSLVADSSTDVSVIAVSSHGYTTVTKMTVMIGTDPNPEPEPGPEPEPTPTPGTYNIGDTVEGGVLYWISDDKTTGKVLYPYRSESDVFTTDAGLLSGLTASEEDGEANVKALKGVDPTLSHFPGAKYCDELEGDWYLPSKNELRTVFSVYNGTGTTYEWGENVSNKKPNEITPDETAARATFDGYILNCAPDGVVLNTQAGDKQGDEYWTSTWGKTYDAARGIRFGQRADQSRKFADGYTFYTRCIKNVELSSTSGSQIPELPAQGAGEYDLYLLIGQSNMSGRGELLDSDLAEEIQGVWLLNGDNNIEVAKSPLNRYSSVIGDDDRSSFSLGVSFSKAIHAKTGRKILIVSNARGSTDLVQWDGVEGNEELTESDGSATPDYRWDDYFDAVVMRVEAAVAKGGKLRAILWHQGCNDIKTYETYMDKLKVLVENYRKKLGNVPFIAGEVNQWRGGTYLKFNEMIRTVGQNIPDSYCALSDGLKNIESEKDLNDGKGGPHFDRASLIVLGERYAEKVLESVYGINDFTPSEMPAE